MRWLWILFVLAVSACGGERPGEEETAGPPLSEGSPPFPEWALDTAAGVRLGVAEGAPELQFSRVAYAARLSDGNFVVVDGASSEVRWFSADGDFLVRAGGRGEGPGELLRVVAATLTPEDSVVLYDSRNQRLTWFGPQGSFSRTRRLELYGTVSLVPLGEARLVVAEERFVPNFGGAEFNHARDSVVIMVMGGAREQMDTVLNLAGRAAVTWAEYAGGGVSAYRQFGLPFGHPTLVGSLSDDIVLTEDGSDAITFFNEDGAVVRVARRTDADRPAVTDALRQRHVRHAMRAAAAQGVPEGPARAGAEALMSMVPPDRRVPPFDRMLTDAVSDRLWIREYLFAWDTGEVQCWTVHDATGRVLARVATPPGLELMQVGPRHVVGVERDELGVEYVVMYPLQDHV